MSPEEKARLEIDEQLRKAGWIVQEKSTFNPYAGLGVAVAELNTSTNKEVDYCLFVDCEPVGLLEAKSVDNGVNLSTDAHEQNFRYAKEGIKGNWDGELRFLFESTGLVTQFTDLKEPNYRTRRIFQVFSPQYLKDLIDEYEEDFNGKTLRHRLKEFPELDKEGLRLCQIDAITNLENSFADNRQRALVQMATGAGKTFTAITSVYRLLKYAKARRILFIVDTNNLGEQAESEFKNYKPKDCNKKFTDLYKVCRIQNSSIPSDTNVCISTIQRLFSMLKGELATFAEESDEENETQTGNVRDVEYNKDYPPEFFDFVIIDECHRSIYNVWRQVVEYFDAFLIGLTATPSARTIAFFQSNMVSQYTHDEAVADGVNVPQWGTFVIETEKNQQGGTVVRDANFTFALRDKLTRKQRYQKADADLGYTAKDLDKAVVNFDEIRLVLQTYKDSWEKWLLFEGRKEVPKTLIFAKDDSHADDIVRICREVFNMGNEFCKKITYSSDEAERTLLNEFRTGFKLRIAVTVSKIAVGTDVKPLEVLIFMRDIRSENYYEQMLGRGRRDYSLEDMQETSPSATTPKLGYVVVDAVGVTKSKKSQSPAKEYKPRVPFKTLLNNIMNGDNSEESLTSFATRLEHINKVLTDKEKEQFEEVSGHIPLTEVAKGLKAVFDPDEILDDCKQVNKDYEQLTEDEQKKINKKVMKERSKKAIRVLFEPKVRDFLVSVRNTNDQTIDPALDRLINSGFVKEVDQSKENVCKTFKDFIEANKETIEALEIIYSRSYKERHLTEQKIRDLYQAMAKNNMLLSQDRIFNAYQDKAKKGSVLKQLMDIIQVVKFEYGQIDKITLFNDHVRKNYQTWIFNKNKNKKGKRGTSTEPFTEEQLKWLETIRDHIAMNSYLDFSDLRLGKFNDMGGAKDFYRIFSDKGIELINELNIALVA